MATDCCVLCVVCCLLSVVCCLFVLLFVVCCVLFVVCCVFVFCCLLFVVCCFCCVLFVARFTTFARTLQRKGGVRARAPHPRRSGRRSRPQLHPTRPEATAAEAARHVTRGAQSPLWRRRPYTCCSKPARQPPERREEQESSMQNQSPRRRARAR